MKTRNSLSICMLVMLSTLAMAGCAAQRTASGPVQGQPETAMELPEYLTANGLKMLAAGNTAEADDLFNRALAADKKFVPALVGMARLECSRGSREKALDWIERAEDRASSPEDRLLAKSGRMQVYYDFKKKSWLEDMESVWEGIRNSKPRPEEATLLMGKAYLEKKRFLEASVCFRQVLDWNGASAGEADCLLSDLYQRLRAEPGSAAGRTVADHGQVSRGDFATLLVEELKLPQYLTAHTPAQRGASFKTPQQFSVEKPAVKWPPDITGHPYELDIRQVLAIGLRGMEPFGDGTFQPEQPLSRSNFALVTEDILVRIKRDPLLSSAFIGNESPFPDVPADHYAFNAIVVCTTRNLLAADLEGVFRPNELVTGPECLLAIRQLKEEINNRQVRYGN